MLQLPVLSATRYVQALREGGSLPAVVDTDGDGMFVAKFRGAGQGAKALIAELVAGLLAQQAGLPSPEIVLIDVSESFGRTEPDPEIQDLLRASHGINVGARYLDGSFNFDMTAAGELVTRELAARIVWFDAFVTNPDRTHRNPNLLIWQRKPWLIDHGAALYAQHDWASVDEARTMSPFPLIGDHVLLGQSGDIDEADAAMTAAITEDLISRVVGAVPDELLSDAAVRADFDTPDTARERYIGYLTARLRGPRAFVREARDAQNRAAGTPPHRLGARR